MNSSLLVPAFLGVAIAAVVGVFFGDSLFSGGSAIDESSYAVEQSAQPSETVGTTDTNSSVDDFSWDDAAVADAGGSLNDANETVKAATKIDASNVPASESFFGSTEQRSVTRDVADRSSDLSDETLDLAGAEKQVTSDLADFFDTASSDSGQSRSIQRSPVRSQIKRPLPKTDEAPATNLFSQPTAEEAEALVTAPMDNFDDLADLQFGQESSGSSAKSKSLAVAEIDSNLSVDELQEDRSMETALSVTSEEPKSMIDLMGSGVEDEPASSLLAGDLEPVFAGVNKTDARMPELDLGTPMVRKLKITNPKETTLPVTMSVNGEHITLQPDQTYVINDENSEVNVMFSRGGSFGFKSQKITTGHYRFSVTRESGWKLSN